MTQWIFCQECGKNFETSNPQLQIFCSTACEKIWTERNPPPKRAYGALPPGEQK
jgi:hypothetical protein